MACMKLRNWYLDDNCLIPPQGLVKDNLDGDFWMLNVKTSEDDVLRKRRATED